MDHLHPTGKVLRIRELAGLKQNNLGREVLTGKQRISVHLISVSILMPKKERV